MTFIGLIIHEAGPMEHPELYNDQVFINCPFDDDYRKIFRAVVFAVDDCGFVPRSALEQDSGAEVRITKIKRIINESRHGIHDISRVELDTKSGLPRFNMPLELGLFLGAQEFGGKVQRTKRCLILDSDPHRYQSSVSDIAGQDIKAHGNKPAGAITAVRDWLGSYTSEKKILLPGEEEMRKRYVEFEKHLPGICAKLKLNPKKLLFNELRTIVEEWTDTHPPSTFESEQGAAPASA
jgi:hypothetical protein